MAPLPPNSTARLKVFYQNAQAEHDAMIRVTDASNLSDAESLFQTITGELTAAYSFSEVTRVEFADDGSDIFLPLVTTTLIGYTWGSDPASEESNATALSFTGRGTAGRRARFFLFGYKNALSEFRITSGESASVEDSITALNAASGAFIAIDGTQPVWNAYANVKANDHWVKRARSG